MKIIKISRFAVVLFCLHSWHVSASNGVLMSGYGAKSSTMGGASIALPYDSLAAANNPAGMAKVGTRMDFNLRVFRGVGDTSFADKKNTNSLNVTTPAPEMGFNYQYDELTTFGVSVFSDGSATSYSGPVFKGLGLDDYYVSAAHITVAPTVTRKFGDGLYIGVAPTFVYGFVKTEGVPFRENDKDSAIGWGGRVGFLWEANEKLKIGAVYSPKVKMDAFDKYKDNLFSYSKGRYDLAEQVGVGLAYKITDRLELAADFLKIYWSDVDFLNDKSGIGYTDQKVWRIGLAYQVSDKLSVRGGYSYADSLADPESANGLYNIPAISNESYSLGLSYDLPDGYELTGGVERNIPKSIKGSGASQGTNIDVDYGYFIFGVSKRF
jgi:long-chain fatty acid transport protein